MKLKNKKILVTGGAGFIGSHFVDKVVENNKVIVIDDYSSGEEENLKAAERSNNLISIRGDIRNLEILGKMMKGVDIVFHFATRCVRESINNPMLVHDVNALGALNLYIEAHKNKIERFIHISSSEVYGSASYVPMDENHPLKPETIYGASKLAGELYGRAYFRTHKLPVTVIRPFNTYGPRSHFAGPYGEVIPRFVIRAINDLPPIIFGDGKQTRDFTYVGDTVEGILKASEEDSLVGDVVNIAHGEERTIVKIANIVLEALRKKSLGVEYQEGRPGDVLRHFASIQKAKERLGFKPKVELEEGIRKYIEWIKNQNIDIKKALKKVQDRNW